MPRFMIPREVQWSSLDSSEVQPLEGADYKFMLSFDKGLYETPWLSLYSANPLLVLKRLDIVFTYSESEIVDFKVYPECA